VASARGATSKDPKESAAGGAEAGKTVATIKSQLLANMVKLYEPDIEDRFFEVQTASAGSMRLTEEGLKDAHEAIKKSDTTLEDQLHTSLDKLGELSKEADAADKLNFVVRRSSMLVATTFTKYEPGYSACARPHSRHQPSDGRGRHACPCVPETSFTRSKREGGFTLLIHKIIINSHAISCLYVNPGEKPV
jgi:hypothetical protein